MNAVGDQVSPTIYLFCKSPLTTILNLSLYRLPEPRNFAEVKKLSENIRKPWLKSTLKEIKNLINNQTFIIEDPKDGEPVTPCMDVYKEKIQSDGSLDKLKLRIVVRGDLQNK